MSSARIDFKGFEEMRAKLNKLGADTEQIAIDALKATNDLVYKAALTAVQKANLPAHGKYSFGDTEKSLRKEPIIEKNGTIVIAHVGFDMSQSGLTSIMLMHGTPYMKPAAGMYDAFYGQTAEIQEAQRAIFERALERIMSE